MCVLAAGLTALIRLLPRLMMLDTITGATSFSDVSSSARAAFLPANTPPHTAGSWVSLSSSGAQLSEGETAGSDTVMMASCSATGSGVISTGVVSAGNGCLSVNSHSPLSPIFWPHCLV